jgi:P-type conjugative transfer ATPase TrbB
MTQLQENVIKLLEQSFGPVIMGFLNDKDVIEVYLNDNQDLWIDTLSKGRKKTGIRISYDDSLRINTLVAGAVGTEINMKTPRVKAELPIGGSRFQGEIPPIVQNPTFNIRKKAIKIFTLEEYVDNGTMTEKQYHSICKAVQEKKNILVIGGTSSGKTTLCNAIINEMAKYQERMIIIEDTQELQCSCEDRVFLRTSDTVTMKDLLEDTLRMRPDRISIGEIRGGAALDLLKAWNSGHPGGICTIHADSPRAGLDQLEQYISEVSVSPQQKMISRVAHILVFIKREGLKRVIGSIAEVKGYKNGEYILEEVK